MTRSTHRLWVAATAALAAGAAASAWAAEPTQPTQQELVAQVKDLQGKVAALQATQQANQADLANTIEGVLRDAEQRSQFLAVGGGGMAGYDNGFFISSDDRSFFLHPSLQFAPRYSTAWRDEAKESGNDDTQSGFEIRRMKLGFDGNIFSKDLTYNFLWATGRSDGLLKLEEAWAKYMFSDAWGFRVGQFKDPVAHEGLVSSKRLLAVERSYLQDVIGLGDSFVQGATLIYDDKGPFRAEVGFTDGTKSSNTNFQDPPTTSADFGVAGRAEYMVQGNYKEYDDFTALGNKDDLLVIGGGGDWTQNGDVDTLLHTIDIQWENTSGLGLYGAYLGRYGHNAAGDGSDLYDYGFLLQGNYVLDKEHWELFARYDFTHFDDDAFVGSENDVHEITLGVNYYFHSHAAKVTVDLSYLPNGAPISDDGADILGSDDQDEIVLRGQFQLLI